MMERHEAGCTGTSDRMNALRASVPAMQQRLEEAANARLTYQAAEPQVHVTGVRMWNSDVSEGGERHSVRGSSPMVAFSMV